MKTTKVAYVFLLLGSFVFLNFLIEIVSVKTLIQITTGDLGLVNKAIGDKSDILILGSSRARNHYNSKLLEAQIGQTVFNGGVSGMGLGFNKAVLLERIKVHQPKKLILDIAPNILTDTKQNEKMHAFYPLLDIYPTFQDFMDGSPTVNFLFRNLASLKYNSSLYDLCTWYFNLGDINDAFNPLIGNIDTSIKPFYYKESKNLSDLIKIQFDLLEEIVRIARKNKIDIVLVISPSFVDFDNSGIIQSQLRNFADNNQVRIVNFSKAKSFASNKKIFYNQLHLNSVGANIFTINLSDSLSEFFDK